MYTDPRPRHYFIRVRGPNASTQTNILDFLVGIRQDDSVEVTQRFTNLNSPNKRGAPKYYSSSGEDSDNGFAQVYAH